MSMREKNTAFAEYLETAEIAPHNPMWEPKVACNVGAHLAFFLDVGIWDYKGIQAWTEMMECNTAEAVLLLRECGSAHNPFGGFEKWPVEPVEVFRRVAARDGKFPATKGADLSYCSLQRGNMFQADFSGANLKWAWMHQSNLMLAHFAKADLSWANLTMSDCMIANFAEANLTGANLYEANLSGAYLGQANLCGADLQRVNFGGARLDGANLMGAKLKGAILDEAVLTGAILTGTCWQDKIA